MLPRGVMRIIISAANARVCSCLLPFKTPVLPMMQRISAMITNIMAAWKTLS